VNAADERRQGHGAAPADAGAQRLCRRQGLSGRALRFSFALA
jgi:hypothetical protein